MLSTLIFSVVLILALVPRVLGGLRRRLPRGPARPEYDYVFHGLLGLVIPMVGIKLIDTLVNAAGFV